jgi:uncharacterized protein YebE (UPF0316 family)
MGAKSMVFDGMIISVILGLLRGGSFRSFSELRLNYGWIFPALLAVQLIVFITQNNFSWMAAISPYIFIAVYVVGLCFLWMNRDQKGIMLIWIGVLLNFIVMIANGGRMPVSLDAAAILDPAFTTFLKEGLYAKHQILTDASVFGFLGDIIPLSHPYPREQVISIGDVIINIGIFMFIQDLMLQHKGKKTSEPKLGGDLISVSKRR